MNIYISSSIYNQLETFSQNQVLHQTIEKDLKDINSRVSEASKNLRIERVRLIKLKVKEVLGKDVHISIKDVNTDVKVQPNLNDLHTTAGIVSYNCP